MQNEFHFKLRNEKRGKYLIQSRAIHIMAGILLMIYGLTFIPNISDEWIMGVSVMIASISVLFFSLFKPRMIQHIHNNRVFRILETAFLIMGALYFFQEDNYLPAVLFAMVSAITLFLLWMETRILDDQFVVFTKNKIEVELPLSTKKIEWNQIQHIILKHDYLTIAFQNEKFQQLGIYPNYTDVDQIQFELFCQEMIAPNQTR